MKRICKAAFIFSVAIIFTVLNWSCHKNTKFERNYFAFGSAFSECEGNCANFYMIRGDDVYADDMSFYESQKDLKFKRNDLGDEKFQIAKKIMDDLPDYLIQHPNQTFGCPDCRDQGGIHIERKVKGKLTKWHIDLDSKEIPAELKGYVEEILETLKKLGN